MTKKVQKCSLCNKSTDILEIFSKGECLACHEKNYKATSNDEAEIIKAFTGDAINK